MKQKIVIKVQMSGNKSRSKALGLVASTHGVQSVAIEGREMNHLVVVGVGLDAVRLTSYLRKKVGTAQIVQVEVVGGAAAEKAAMKPPATAAAEKTMKPPATAAVSAGPHQQWQPRYYSSYYSRPAAVRPYTGQHCYEYDDYSHPDAGSSCAVM